MLHKLYRRILPLTKVFVTALFCFLSVIASSQTVDSLETYIAPEKPAEFPGGMAKLARYINDNFTSKVVISRDEAAVFRKPVIHFTIDETGRAIDVRIINSTNIPEADKLFVEAVKSMPLWKPAEQGDKKVRQEFNFPVTICFK
jgi:TonB family protein